jgi:phage gp29-like protein
VAEDNPDLVDHLGRPMKRPANKAALSQAVATSGLTSIRQAWTFETIVSGLTPERLARVMRQAAEGDHYDYAILANEMEERDWHYAGALNQRKLAIVELDRIVEAASEDDEDQKIAQAVREAIVEDECFEDLLTGCLDALGKGWAAVEIAWDTGGALWRPASYEWRDPRWFRWDRETGQQLRLIDETDTVFGIELPPNRFAVHLPKLKMGLPVRGGLARLAAWAFLFKFYSVKDWAAYCETYGQPLRLGKYAPNATKEDIDVLYRAVAMIGADCAAVIPQAMQIEFVDAMKGASMSGADLYMKFCDWLDRQVSKAVLGQTGTTDMQKGGGLAQAKVLDGVREDLRGSDAKQLSRTVRRAVIEPFVRFNFGPDAKVPGLKLQADEPEDLEKLAAGLAPFIDRGLKVSASQIREKFKLDEPKGDTDVLQAAAAGGGNLPNDKQVASANRRRLLASTAIAVNSASAGGQADADQIDQLADPLNEGWEQVMAPLIEPIEHLAQRAGSYAEFERDLGDAAQHMDPTALFRGLAAAAFKARGLGDASDGS